MSSNSVHDWKVILDFDASRVEKGVAKVEKIMSKLDKLSFSANERYQEQLNKQIRTLHKQRDLVKDINKLSGGNTRTSPSGPRQPRSSTTSRTSAAAFAASSYKVGVDLKDFNESVGQRVDKTSDKFRDLTNRIERMQAALKGAKSASDLSRIRADLTSAKRAAVNYERAQKKLNRTMSAGKFAAKGLGDSLRNFARSYLSVFAVIGAGALAYRAMANLDTIKSSLLAASGSAEQAAIDFAYVGKVSMELGRDLQASAKGYSQLAIAADLAGVSVAETRNIFESVMEASTAFGLSADDTYGSLKALVQMLSKNSIQAEELKSQLGDRMPIAVSIMARAVGVTTQELFKMMEAGQLMSSEVLPKFAVELKKAARQGGALEAGMQTISAAQQRMATSFTMVMDEMSQAGGKEGIVDIFNTLSDIMVSLTPAFRTLGVLIKWVGRTFKLTFGTLTTLLSPFINLVAGLINVVDKGVDTMFRFGEAGKKADDKLNPLEKTLRNIGDRIRKLLTGMRMLIAYVDSYNSTMSEGNFALNHMRLMGGLVGNDKGQALAGKIQGRVNSQMADFMNTSMLMGGSGPKVNNSTSKSQVFNVNVDFKSTNADPAGVRKEFENFFQTKLRTLAVPPA